MKKRGKLKQFLIAMIVVVMGISVMLPVQAATRKDAKATVQYASIPATIETISSGDVYIKVKKPSDRYEIDYDMRILNRKGKVIRFSEKTLGIEEFESLKKNQLYYYQIREVETTSYPWGGESVTKGAWTKKVPFIIAQYPVSQVGTARKVRIKMPKIQGVKNYKVYISDKKNKGWKKLKTVKSGGSVIISKFKGKALKKNKKYYYKIVPNKGVNSTIAWFGFKY